MSTVDEKRYRYFIQPQLDKINNTLIGYELLMKYHTPDGWRPPHSFAEIPPKIIADTLVETVKQLELKIGSVSVNINRTQLMDPQIDDAIIQSQSILRPLKLIVELTEEPDDENFKTEQIIEMVQRFTDRGMELSVDDVGMDQNNLDHVKPLLPYATEMKFALQDLSASFQDKETQKQVKFWQNVACQYNLRFILEGIEDAEDDATADQLDIDLRQGYFYGKPHLLKINADDPDQ